MTGLDPLWNDDEADPLRFEFSPWSGELRRGGSLSNLRYAGLPVLRAVRPVLRDRDWRTAPATVASLDEIPGGLSVTGAFRDELGEDAVHADWWLDVRATDHEFAVEFTAAARTTFQRNRFGLVVLHRTDDCGVPLRVGHPDGSTTDTGFPVGIAPHQPARDIASLRWSRPGVDVAVEFHGDVFEMEDQRNWTDASFKTYSTPLDEPFPVEVPAGTTVRQRVVVRCAPNAVPVPPEPVEEPIDLVPSGEPLPQFASTAPVEGFDGPLLVELVTDDPRWRTVLSSAHDTGLPLDVRLVTDDPAALAEPLAALDGSRLVRLGVHSLATHVSAPELWQVLRNGAAQQGITADLVAGARSHFTELNRTLEVLPDDAAGVVFASTPQMHDTGRDQVLESLPIQRLTAEQAVTAAHGRPVHVGPVTLQARFNAVATTAWRVDRDRRQPDPRSQGTAFAAWVVASAAAFSVPGVASVTFGDVDGPAGESLRLLAGIAGWERLEPGSAPPPGLHVIAGRRGARTVALVANLADRRRSLLLSGAQIVVEPGRVVLRELPAGG